MMEASSAAPRILEPIALWPPGDARGQPASPGVQQLTPYLPAARRGAIVVCPGGGYGHLAAHEGEPVARWLAGLGIAAFVLSYRVAPHRHPAPLRDARRALRLVRCRAGDWGIDATPAGVLGFSA